MKKTICILLSFLLLLSFAGCAKENTDNNDLSESVDATDNSTDPSAVTEAAGVVFNSATDSSPAVYAVVSNDKPAVGEQIIIDFRLCNAPLFSSIDLRMEYNENALDVQYAGNCQIENATNECNIKDGKIIYAAYVMRTAQVDDASLFKVAVTPKSGTTGLQTITVNGMSLLLALDENGNSTVDKTQDMITTDVTLSVN